MGSKFNTSAYVMKAMLLQMATMRRLTMSFMPNAANTKAEAINPIVLLSVMLVRITLCGMVALCTTAADMTTLDENAFRPASRICPSGPEQCPKRRQCSFRLRCCSA
jgi:hypothetical protein